MAGYQNFGDTVKMRRSRMAGQHAYSGHSSIKTALAHYRDSLVYLSSSDEEKVEALIKELQISVTQLESLFTTHVSNYNRYGADKDLSRSELE